MLLFKFSLKILACIPLLCIAAWEPKLSHVGRPLVRSLLSSCVLFFGQFWSNRWNPLCIFDPPVFNSWNQWKGLLRKDISYSSRAETPDEYGKGARATNWWRDI
jgi:hypothetical protein